jgi:hypothetical protein
MNEAFLKPAEKCKAGFWWISLACLAGIFGFVVYLNSRGEMTTNRKTTSLATAIAIESAVNCFYIEYGTMPDVGTRVKTDTPEGVKLLVILLGLEDKAANPQNKRGVKFLSVKEGKDHRNGLVYSPKGDRPEGLYDRWANPYTVELDTQYREQLQFTIASRAVDLKGRRVAVYTPGPDKKLGTSDDVRTW